MSSALDRARRLLVSAQAARHAKRRRPPEIRFSETTSSAGSPHVYYLSPDPEVPRGGVRVFYRHVDLLNAAGLPATVVHNRRGYRADWFPNDTRVAAGPDVVVTPADIVVVPEFYTPRLDLLPPDARLVVFNQAPYYTFEGMDPAEVAAFPRRPVEAILTISEAGVDLLRHTFDSIPVHLSRAVLEPEVFHPGEGGVRGRRLAYATNRRASEAHQLLSILRTRGVLQGWEVVPIRGMSEAEVARTLRTCALFLSFSERDGFGLPPAEAMASGCYVVGYTGQGGDEFFDPAYSAPVADGALLAYARAVEEAISAHDAEPAAIAKLGLAASDAILSRYTTAGLRDDLLTFYRSLGLDRTRT